jgi:hypothetical protein
MGKGSGVFSPNPLCSPCALWLFFFIFKAAFPKAEVLGKPLLIVFFSFLYYLLKKTRTWDIISTEQQVFHKQKRGAFSVVARNSLYYIDLYPPHAV